MEKFKQCKQCGEIKPQEQYRKYYGGRKGTYNTCKLCEKINSREKYLVGKAEPTEKEQSELDKIYELWDCQVYLGLRPPSVKRKVKEVNLDDMISKYTERVTLTKSVVREGAEAPAELLKWLTEELTEDPDYYQDEVYNALARKYRPQLSIDKSTMMPVYDDTYRALLQQIAAKFDEYEDGYYD